MNWKTWLPLGLAIVLGIAAAKLGRDMLAGRGAIKGPGNLGKVMVAKVDLPPGHEITEVDVKLGNVPADAVPTNTYTSAGDLIGRVVQTPIVANQAIAENLLTSKGTGSGLQALIPDGMRAITVEVNEYSGVAGLLVPGCRVDLIGTMRDEKSAQQVVRTLVENVKVMAVGQRLGVNRDGGIESTGQLPRSVTLVVAPRDAEAIELASNSGRTRLVLRSSSDNALARSEGMTIGDLIGVSRDSGASAATVAAAQTDATTRPATLVHAVSSAQTRPAAASAADLRTQARRTIQVIRQGQSTTVDVEVRREPPATPAAPSREVPSGTTITDTRD